MVSSVDCDCEHTSAINFHLPTFRQASPSLLRQITLFWFCRRSRTPIRISRFPDAHPYKPRGISSRIDEHRLCQSSRSRARTSTRDAKGMDQVSKSARARCSYWHHVGQSRTSSRFKALSDELCSCCNDTSSSLVHQKPSRHHCVWHSNCNVCWVSSHDGNCVVETPYRPSWNSVVY